MLVPAKMYQRESYGLIEWAYGGEYAVSVFDNRYPSLEKLPKIKRF